jgi:hypothetical protein
MVNYLCPKCKKIFDEDRIVLIQWESVAMSGFTVVCRECYRKHYT